MMIDDKPLVSCVVATKNRAHLIKAMLHSLRHQTYDNWEAIIVQDWTEDWTNFVVECVADKRIHLYSNEGKGKSAAMNLAKRWIKGKYVCVFDDDDIMVPCKLEKSVQMMEETGADFGYSARYTHLLNNQIVYTPTRRFEMMDHLEKPMMGFGSIITTKELFDKIEWDEKLLASLDFDWITKVAMTNPTMAYTQIPLYIWRNHLDSITYENNVLQKMMYQKVKRKAKRDMKKLEKDKKPLDIKVIQWPKEEDS